MTDVPLIILTAVLGWYFLITLPWVVLEIAMWNSRRDTCAKRLARIERELCAIAMDRRQNGN